MLLVVYRPGFRASEICDLEWSAIDFPRAEMHVSRRKAGKPSTHPIRGGELRELRKLRRESTGPFVFMTERGGPFTTDNFNRMVKRAGQKAKLPFQVHAHMIRHATGYKLANAGKDTNPGLPWPQRYPTYRPLHLAVAEAVPGFLGHVNDEFASNI